MMTTATLDDPRAPYTRRRGVNLEKWGWIYMRGSGVLLIVLIFGHLIVNLLTNDGIKQIDFAFVGGKLSDPFWKWWDVTMLWLALIHGANGMRTIVNDYVGNETTRKVLVWALWLSAAFLIVLGTLVVFTFDPCPAGSPADLLPALCSE